jgi:two-component system response regulator HupR/HoxA
MRDAGVHPVLLVVDDEPLNRDLLRRVLYQEFEIREAEDAFAALKILEESGPIDVMVCDHLMPGRSGADLARDVRARWPLSVVLLLTGYDDSPEVDSACKEGAIFEVVGKPFVAQRLKEALARAMAERMARQAKVGSA